uniref:Uncharacterized protein n=1 Tax=viral metagenome TaxID=1070528 RepID=A0A6C0KNT4_9ZZZZ
MAVFNDPPPGKKPTVRLEYGTANKARRSVKRLQKQPLAYQTQAAHTLYYRAKYHKYQTKGMKQAMKIYGRFLQTLRKTSTARRPKAKRPKAKRPKATQSHKK